MTSDEATETGRAVRKDVPRSSHGDWTPAADRPDPVGLIEGQNADRLEWLLPVRRARMSASPFTFYRGAARLMATDLAATPNSGLNVQLCGDAHLSNFGVYASPERKLVFDLNDFDETLPGPFEWDVKRLAASFAIAAQNVELGDEVARKLAERVTEVYRNAMAEFAERSWLEMWYAHLPFDDLLELSKSRGASKKALKRGEKFAKKARSKDNLRAAQKLVDRSGDAPRFRSDPPLLVPFDELPDEAHPDRRRESVNESLRSYRSSLSGQMQWLFARYQMVDGAIKVVGVGSVGTRCSVGLFLGRHESDVLLLQIKEATHSVLEEHLEPSRYERHGRRVVEGQRLLQGTSDIFLGWSRSSTGREFYWRQLKDWKGSADLDNASHDLLARYADLCGFTLARAHAVTGDPTAIAAYLGKGDVFDRAMGEYSIRYAAQNVSDAAKFSAAIAEGRLEASELQS